MYKKLCSFLLSLLMLAAVGLVPVPLVSVGIAPLAISTAEAANTIYYSKTARTGGGATALDSIDGALLADGDWAYVSELNILYTYKLNATSGAAESSPDIISPDTNAGTKRWILQTSYPLAGLSQGHLSGLEMSHAADTDHDIVVAAGKARDSTDAVDMVLSASITKRFDATWVAGSTNGGSCSGEALPASGTWHVWVIKSTAGVVDVCGNDNALTGLTPSLPATYSYKRQIGSYRTDSSSNIINGDWFSAGRNRRFKFDTPILDVNSTNPGTNAVTAALSVPTGVIVSVKLNVEFIVGDAGWSYLYISSLANTDLSGGTLTSPLFNCRANGSLNAYDGIVMDVESNASSQIRYRISASGANEKVGIATLGYEMSL